VPPPVEIHIRRLSRVQGHSARLLAREPLGQGGGDLSLADRIEQVPEALDIRKPDERRDGKPLSKNNWTGEIPERHKEP
jgi:hypothetical protein